MTTMRQKAIDFVNNMSDEELESLLVCSHDTNSHKWMEVYPDGTVHEAEEADNNTRHYIRYPKPVASIYDINQATGGSCNCDDCTMYRHFAEMSKEEFVERYDENVWDYCSSTTLEECILETAHDNGIYGEDIRTQMLDAINEIEYGYFNGEI